MRLEKELSPTNPPFLVWNFDDAKQTRKSYIMIDVKIKQSTDFKLEQIF